MYYIFQRTPSPHPKSFYQGAVAAGCAERMERVNDPDATIAEIIENVNQHQDGTKFILEFERDPDVFFQSIAGSLRPIRAFATSQLLIQYIEENYPDWYPDPGNPENPTRTVSFVGSVSNHVKRNAVWYGVAAAGAAAGAAYYLS